MQSRINNFWSSKPPKAPSPGMELGHWVTGSMGHLSHLSRPGHRVIILTRCDTRVFSVFEKMPKMMQILLFGAGYK